MADPPNGGQLLELPVGEFLDRTASASPTPGGGSVAAVTGALASALVAMVARLTAGKKGYEQAWELAGAAVGTADRLTADLQAAALEDVCSFEAYLAALRLPKASAEERRTRRVALAAATRRATAAPLAIAAACAEILSQVGAAGAGREPPCRVGHRRRGSPGRGRRGRRAADRADQSSVPLLKMSFFEGAREHGGKNTLLNVDENYAISHQEQVETYGSESRVIVRLHFLESKAIVIAE